MNRPPEYPSWLDMGEDPSPPAAPRTAPQQGSAAPHTPPPSPEPDALATDAVGSAALRRRAAQAPARGWRRALFRASGGTLNLGDSPADARRARLVHAVRRPVRDDYRIAVLSLKGGVGKTTTTIGLGATLASTRGDRVIAVDANPDLGTLAQRVPQQTSSTVRDLIATGPAARYSDVRAHTSQAPSRLEVLSSERDPARVGTFGAGDYHRAMEILRRHYNILLTDCGTGMSNSVMTGVLDHADALIVVTSPAIDGARSAAATLDWLSAHGHRELAASAVVVVCAARSSACVDVDRLAEYFRSRTRAVHQVPFDAHLAEGAEVDLDRLHSRTAAAFLELAATVADGFADTARRA
ncbi:MinD/ParA family ATP-binding protein [Gordonia aichiensis]|uniref:MinD/ParA family ATP-binding protein n=1 Tax=Gordonia aichiensis TaxID=36820 RepID=UPI003265DD27